MTSRCLGVSAGREPSLTFPLGLALIRPIAFRNYETKPNHSKPQRTNAHRTMGQQTNTKRITSQLNTAIHNKTHQTTTNQSKPQRTTENHRKLQQTPSNHCKPNFNTKSAESLPRVCREFGEPKIVKQANRLRHPSFL